MLMAMIFAGMATAALVPLMFVSDDDAEDPTADKTTENTGDLLDDLGVVYDIPAASAQSVLNTFDADTDRVALHLESWDAEFVLETMEEGGVRLSFDAGDGPVHVEFPALGELPLDLIDVSVQAPGEDAPTVLTLADVLAANEEGTEDDGDGDGGDGGDGGDAPLAPTDPDSPETPALPPLAVDPVAPIDPDLEDPLPIPSDPAETLDPLDPDAPEVAPIGQALADGQGATDGAMEPAGPADPIRQALSALKGDVHGAEGGALSDDTPDDPAAMPAGGDATAPLPAAALPAAADGTGAEARPAHAADSRPGATESPDQGGDADAASTILENRPVRVADFGPRDALEIELDTARFAHPGAPRIEPSPDGGDGYVYVDDRLVAILEGAPQARAEQVRLRPVGA